MSHPVWVRGLKLSMLYHIMLINKSHPVWVRGLKQNCRIRPTRSKVAPRVGAWIETLCY